jgi:hypothetical protein
MENRRHDILILIMVLFAMSMPHAVAQTNPQLSIFLVGENTGHYVTPAGQTTTLQLEVMNVARSDVYLLQGEVYLDPHLSSTWTLIHSEQLGSFHLQFLQSAIWTFHLAVPANIQATNATAGTPQVNLLVKIIYQAVEGAQGVEQGMFTLGVPGATVQRHYNVIWYALIVLPILMCIGIAYIVTKRRRKQ